MPPLFGEIRRQAVREKRRIVCIVMMANDSLRMVSFGPRGGWAFKNTPQKAKKD